MANVVTLRKQNRVIEVSESLADGYLKRGYDQIDKNGKVVKAATGGKTVSLSEHNKVLKQLKDIKENGSDGGKLRELEEEVKSYEDEIEKLTEENNKLKNQLQKARKGN